MSGDRYLLHLSDTHLLDDPAARLFGFDPDENLRRTLAHVAAMPVDLAGVIISGDLAHVGAPAAYARLADLIAPVWRRGTPVLLGLGNHDDRDGFRQVFAGAARAGVDGRFCYSRRIGDLRVVMLDSLAPGAVWGELGRAQLDWLARELREPAPGGDLLVVHHPVTPPGVPWLNDLLLVDAPALAETLRGHRLLGILAGHCHAASAAPFAGTLAATAPGVAFQFDHHPGEGGKVLPGCGFNLCTVGPGGLIINPVLLPAA